MGLKKIESRLNRRLKQLTKTIFACRPDACEALLQFQEQLETHQLRDIQIQQVKTKRYPGQTTIDKSKTSIDGYRIQGKLQLKAETPGKFSRQRSRFILATNQLDREQWSAQRLLEEYKQ